MSDWKEEYLRKFWDQKASDVYIEGLKLNAKYLAEDTSIPGLRDHSTFYNNAGDDHLPDAYGVPRKKPVKSGHPIDIAKNWAGGYDWGYRLGLSNPEEARRMGALYQYKDYTLNPIDNATGNNKIGRWDTENDYLENLQGVEAGIRARQNGWPMDHEELLKAAKRFADSYKRTKK